jgi:proteic killer suppression protein
MITTFRSKALKELFESGSTRRIEQKYHRRAIDMLDVINRAASIQDCNVAGWNLHALAPQRPSVWSTRAWGPFRITFRFEGGNAYDVDLEQYH